VTEAGLPTTDAGAKRCFYVLSTLEASPISCTPGPWCGRAWCLSNEVGPAGLAGSLGVYDEGEQALELGEVFIEDRPWVMAETPAYLADREAQDGSGQETLKTGHLTVGYAALPQEPPYLVADSAGGWGDGGPLQQEREHLGMPVGGLACGLGEAV
jgi:hypothetical protein